LLFSCVSRTRKEEIPCSCLDSHWFNTACCSSGTIFFAAYAACQRACRRGSWCIQTHASGAFGVCPRLQKNKRKFAVSQASFRLFFSHSQFCQASPRSAWLASRSRRAGA
jgi:hypothetical protein